MAIGSVYLQQVFSVILPVDFALQAETFSTTITVFSLVSPDPKPSPFEISVLMSLQFGVT